MSLLLQTSSRDCCSLLGWRASGAVLEETQHCCLGGLTGTLQLGTAPVSRERKEHCRERHFETANWEGKSRQAKERRKKPLDFYRCFRLMSCISLEGSLATVFVRFE